MCIYRGIIDLEVLLARYTRTSTNHDDIIIAYDMYL